VRAILCEGQMRYFGTEPADTAHVPGGKLFETNNFAYLLELVGRMKEAAREGHLETVQTGYRHALCESTEYFGWQKAPRAVSYLSLADFYRGNGDENGFKRVQVLLQEMLLS